MKVSVNNKKYTLKDMQKWFVQITGFPSVLHFGTGRNQVSGEGQFGGRRVSDTAKQAENLFVEKMGVVNYQRGIDNLMKKDSPKDKVRQVLKRKMRNLGVDI